MTLDGATLIGAIVVGIGATFLTDVWNLFLKRRFRISSLNSCMLGRWIGHMSDGIFWHDSIAAVPRKRFECVVGWMAHYTIGVGLTLAFVVWVSADWLAQPTILPPLFFGLATVVFPLFILQPSLGLGVASSRTPDPVRARLKSLMTHTVFGLGLWVSAFAVNLVLPT